MDTSSEEKMNYTGLKKQPQKILCFPVHDWFPCDEVYEKLFFINQEIWEGIQKGHVVVHCLAGFHRSSCVVVSHFLFRYYFLEHKDIPFNIQKIYEDLGSIRKGVVILDFGPVLEGFQNFLVSKKSTKT